MKYAIAVCLALMTTYSALAQQTLSSTMEVYVFPQEGQDASQQSQAEMECYDWAVGNTGSDPFDLQKQAAADAEQAQIEQAQAAETGRGAGAGGAVRGAAAGAIVGEIADNDVGHSAAVGAAIGAVSSRRRARSAQNQAVAQADQQSESREQATDGQLTNFKKAFSVCLEAQDYMVKY